MCGRYWLPTEDLPEEWLRLLDALGERTDITAEAGRKTAGEIFPGDTVPVIARSRRLVPTPFFMRWGFSERGRLLFNARSETADEKPLFRESAKARRCLMPAGHYFEWEHGPGNGKKTRYAIRPAEPGMLYLAGLYRFEGTLPVFTVLTRPPEESIAFIHDRMPLMLPASARDAWLDDRYDLRELTGLAVRDVVYSKS